MSSRSHIQHLRQLFAMTAGLFVAVVPVMAAVMVPTPVGATSEYNNAAIADKALSYVGRKGGNACIDSRKPGDSGGQCRAFVNCIVWMTSGGTQNLGGRNYFTPFLKAGGTEIRSLDALRKGDIVQEGQGRHTFIIVKHVSDKTFTVVDSNRKWNERVYTYDRQVNLTTAKRAFRMGTVVPEAPAVPPKPMHGHLDSVDATKDGAIVKGWAIDSDVTRPIDVLLYAGKETARPEDGAKTLAEADVSRMDVARQFPNFGSSHGFRSFIPLEKGNHIVCVYGVNAPGTPGEDIKLGCRAVTVK